MYVDLLHIGTLNVDILELLRGNVLSLCKLENVLRAVNDLDRTVGHDHTYVTRHQPAVFQSFLSLFGILEVT